MDVNYQAGLEGLRLAHEKGLAVVIMEPLRGGTLANVSEDVAAMLPKNPVQCALEFLWDMPEVNVVLSGMNETCQVEQNMAIAEAEYQKAQNKKGFGTVFRRGR
jgi:predicted aldo/keto reductase-like oxidoreductase